MQAMRTLIDVWARCAGRQPAARLLLVVSTAGVALLVAAAAASPTGPGIDVPRGLAPAIDGRFENAEWRGAVTSALPDGGSVRLVHDGRYLFVGIDAGRRGFPSLCVATGDVVRVLHASAALGSVTYTRSTNGWTTRATEFVYGMRTPDLTPQAGVERRRYLEAHGWVASTFQMSDGRVHELQIAIEPPSARLAVAMGYFAISGDSGTVLAWPESLAAADGCADEKLVRGHVPTSLRFAPESWATLRLLR